MRNLHQPQRMKLRHQPPHKQIIYRNQYAPLSFQKTIIPPPKTIKLNSKESHSNISPTYVTPIVIEFFLDLNASY